MNWIANNTKIIKKYEEMIDNVAFNHCGEKLISVICAKRAVRRAVKETAEKLKQDRLEEIEFECS